MLDTIITTTSHKTAAPTPKLCAGIDVGKARLDVALSDGQSLKSFSNDADGHVKVLAALAAAHVKRVGIEATGGYEIAIISTLRAHGFEVQVFQPMQVRAYGHWKLRRAKSDKIDAALIANCTADLGELRAPVDPRLLALSQHLTLVDQIAEDIGRARIRCEHGTDERVAAHHKSQIKHLMASKREHLKFIEMALRNHPDLAQRLDLIVGINGVGMRTAITMVIRMPELGRISREQAASLLGVAPFVRESGAYHGERHVAGGRMRPRTALFACVQAALQWNNDLKIFYDRLRKNGKHYSTAIMACTRKLIVLINAILKSNQPWTVEKQYAKIQEI